VWEVATSRELLALGHMGRLGPLAWSPDGERMAIANGSDVTVCKAAGDGEPVTLKGHTDLVRSVSWSRDSKRLATGGMDGTARVWDAATGQQLLEITGHANLIDCVTWSPDGQRLATSGGDASTKVWDAADGQELVALQGPTGGGPSVSWSPDGQRLATGSMDGTAKVWDATDGRELLNLKGHAGAVISVSWSPDGKRLATASADRTVRVWETARGRELLTLKGHTDTVGSLSWSPDGKRLATEGNDGVVKVWEAASAEAVREWARQDRAREERLARNTFRGPQAQGFIQDWLLLLPVPFLPEESGGQTLDRQLPGEPGLRPRAGQPVRIGDQALVWQKYHSPNAVLDFNAVLGKLTARYFAYAACYLRSDRQRNDLWLQVGSDDQAKVSINGQDVYQFRIPRALGGPETIGPLSLEQGTNVLLFQVANEGADWLGCIRLVDEAGRPAQGIRYTLTPEP
jgi:WD40 repeat protein